MRRLLATSILGLSAACAIGCSSQMPGSPSAAWIDGYGGITQGGSQQRADLACARLLDERLACRVKVCVLGSTVPAGYSWPDGEVFVTSGLVDVLSDDELAAAIAHEMGHLLGDGHLNGVATLHGHRQGFDAEVDADARGAGLMKAAGLPPAAMTSMLTKVRDSRNLPSSCRIEIDRRIAILTLHSH